MADHKDDIEKYLRGELTPEEMHALEKKALNDPFLADALEGAGSIDHHDFKSDMADIDTRIAARQMGRRSWLMPLRIAAALLFLMVATSVVYWLAKPEEPVTIAQQTTKETPAEKKETEELQNLSKVPPKLSETEKDQFSEVTKARDEALSRARQEAELSAKSKQSERLNKEEIESLPNVTAETKQPAKEREQAKPSETGPPATAQAEVNTRKTGISSETNSSALNYEPNKKKKTAGAEAPVNTDLLDDSKSDKDLVPGQKKEPTRLSYSGSFAFSVAQNVIKGKVTVAEDGTSLPGASIIVKGTQGGAVSNIDGDFSITTKSQQDTLIVSFIGFETRTVVVSKGPAVNIALASDPVQLSEVVVTSFGSKPIEGENEEVITLATPAGGTRAYHQYLKKNIRYPEAALVSKIEGKVGLEFIVSPDGGLSDLKITRSLGYGCDEEVIRLVREGPVWEPSFLGSKKLSSKVRVRLKFKLPR